MANRVSINKESIWGERFLGEGAEGFHRLRACPPGPGSFPKSFHITPYPRTVERASSPFRHGQDGRATGIEFGSAGCQPREEQAESLFSRPRGWEGDAAEGERAGGPRPNVPGPPPTSQLYLLAAVHGDPAGYERAWRFFAQVRPQVITVEISPFSVRYRQRAGKKWRRRLWAALGALPPDASQKLAVARVAAQTALPFEYRAARDWGKLHTVPVKLLDAGAAARVHLPRYAEELLSAANLRFLCENEVDGALEDFVAQEVRRARLAREGKLRVPPRCGEDHEDRQRERLWARRLRRLLARGHRVAHLGGWEHLVPWPGGGGLSHLLADLQPCIVLLDEADGLQYIEG